MNEHKTATPPGKTGGGKDWTKYYEALALRESGMTFKAIAEQKGVSITRIRAVSEMAQSVVTNVAAMAKDRYAQLKDEGSL